MEELRGNLHRLVDAALDLSRDTRGEREDFDTRVRDLIRDAFGLAQMERAEDLLDAVSACLYLERRVAQHVQARTAAFEEMTDEEIRAATGGSLMGTLAYQPPLRIVQEGDAA